MARRAYALPYKLDGGAWREPVGGGLAAVRRNRARSFVGTPSIETFVVD
jgi:hypothetical protein